MKLVKKSPNTPSTPPKPSPKGRAFQNDFFSYPPLWGGQGRVKNIFIPEECVYNCVDDSNE